MPSTPKNDNKPPWHKAFQWRCTQIIVAITKGIACSYGIFLIFANYLTLPILIGIAACIGVTVFCISFFKEGEHYYKRQCSKHDSPVNTAPETKSSIEQERPVRTYIANSVTLLTSMLKGVGNAFFVFNFLALVTTGQIGSLYILPNLTQFLSLPLIAITTITFIAIVVMICETTISWNLEGREMRAKMITGKWDQKDKDLNHSETDPIKKKDPGGRSPALPYQIFTYLVALFAALSKCFTYSWSCIALTIFALHAFDLSTLSSLTFHHYTIIALILLIPILVSTTLFMEGRGMIKGIFKSILHPEKWGIKHSERVKSHLTKISIALITVSMVICAALDPYTLAMTGPIALLGLLYIVSRYYDKNEKNACTLHKHLQTTTAIIMAIFPGIFKASPHIVGSIVMLHFFHAPIWLIISTSIVCTLLVSLSFIAKEGTATYKILYPKPDPSPICDTQNPPMSVTTKPPIRTPPQPPIHGAA